MKLQKLMQLLSIEYYYSVTTIEKTFDGFHSHFIAELSYWSISATRRKIITNFWVNVAATHLSILLLTGVLVCQICPSVFIPMSLRGLLLITPVISVCLLFSLYWPVYYFEFLPKLDSYCEHFSGKQLEGMQKCKKQQYSVLGLMLIQFVIHKVAGTSTPSLSAKENNVLVKLYRVFNKMVEASLKTIIQNDWDRTKERKRTEIQEAFAEAYDYFEVFGSETSIPYLQEFEQKLFSYKKAKSSATSNRIFLSAEI